MEDAKHLKIGTYAKQFLNNFKKIYITLTIFLMLAFLTKILYFLYFLYATAFLVFFMLSPVTTNSITMSSRHNVILHNTKI